MSISNTWARPAGFVFVIVLVTTALCTVAPAETTTSVDTKTVLAWGRNTWNESDIVPGLGDVKQISSTAHNVVLKNDGTVVSWGHNTYGESDVPEGLTDVVEVASGGFHSMALKRNGSLVMWGQNTHGQATAPDGLDDIAHISGGRFHSLVLHDNGKVSAWGSNSHGQSDVPSDLKNVVAIDGGGWHNVALLTDGTVKAWGSNQYGQTDVPAGLKDVVAVAAGWNHSMAMRDDGTVVAWGSDEFGQSSVPEDLPPVSMIAAGGTHSLVAFPDGTVATWGDEAFGIQQIPEDITGVTQISAKAMHSVVIADDPPPTQVRNLYASALSNTKVTLNWNRPNGLTDGDVHRFIVRRASGAVPPAQVTDGVDIPVTWPRQYATDTAGVPTGQQVSYSVFAVDLAGNAGTPTSLTFPAALPGPVTGTTATLESPTSLTLSWVNPDVELRRSIVRRADGTRPPESATSGRSVALPEGVVTGVTLTGLATNTTYSYSVFAQDRFGNVSPLVPNGTVTVNTSTGVLAPGSTAATPTPTTPTPTTPTPTPTPTTPTTPTPSRSASTVRAKAPRKVRVGMAVRLRVRVSDARATGTVRVLRKGRVISRAAVENGMATARLRKFAKAGRVRLAVTYSGSASLAPSSSSLVLRVRK
ncbi:hypothetical protein EXE58_03700 [Nocardioides seonyuensis]|uniref:Fibronectin type-III domain-containing protein n=1 Tax=Nocardioides seonyuensis TaxID=2518371 RepID=A0A4P7IFA5_9ACTN|nr:hypothetical protein [Nocardioides seonyuensis]QBX54657.1 hypothetical protein EXE58_03700 [Nocardioides seonyuensis]